MAKKILTLWVITADYKGNAENYGITPDNAHEILFKSSVEKEGFLRGIDFCVGGDYLVFNTIDYNEYILQKLVHAKYHINLSTGNLYNMDGDGNPLYDTESNIFDTTISEFFSEMTDEDYKVVIQALPNQSHLTKFQVAYLVEMDRLSPVDFNEKYLYQYLHCQYRDGANYKTGFNLRIKVGGTFPNALEEGDEITMKQLGYGESNFITKVLNLSYDSEYDHDGIEILEIITDAIKISEIEANKSIDTLVEVD